MKVAIIQEHVGTARGGAETSTIEMARHLAALGLDVSLVHSAADATPHVEDNVTYLPIARRERGKTLATYRFIQGVHRLCRDEAFDVVHAVTPCLSATVYQPRGGTYVETVRRTLARTPPARRWLKRLGRRFNVRQRFLMRIERLLLQSRRARPHVAALSDYVRRQVLDTFDIPPDHVRVVFNGVEIAPRDEAEHAQLRDEARRALRISAAEPVVLFVAHNFRLKGLGELLHAAAVAGAAGQTWKLLVAGRGDTRPFGRLARRVGVEERIGFVGAEAPIRTLYAAADVLAHPTWYDPCSRVVLEALSVGLPAVTTHHNGAAEIIEPGRHGALVERADQPAALADGIARALQPDVRAACRLDAGRMHERLSMARHARELKALYEEITAR